MNSSPLQFTNPNTTIQKSNGAILVLDQHLGTQIYSYWVDNCYIEDSKITDIALLDADLIVAG